MPSKTPHPLWQHLRKFVDSPLGIVLGTSIYAIWAAYVNWGAGFWIAMRSGLGQWVLSITLTYCGFRVMRAFYGDATPWIAAPRALFGGLAVNYAFFFSMHGLLHTPVVMPIFYASLLPTLLADSSYILLLIKTHNHPPADQHF